MCSNAKAGSKLFTPACVSIITSAVLFTTRLSAAARARCDDYLLVISKSYTDVLDAGKAGWLARQASARDYYGLSVPMPLPGAHQTLRKSLVATNGDAKRPCY